METCCATEDCVYKSNDAAYGRHRQVVARACEGWKLEWTDPGPEVKVVNAVVPGPFEEPKLLKALPYTVISKCGSCVPRDRQRLRNGIPDPWLEYLEHEARKSREGDEDSALQRDAGLVKRCIRITDFVWHKKGLAMLQGIPDPWKSDLPCVCEVNNESNNKKKKSHDKTITRRRSSTHERESPRRRSSKHEKESPRRRSSTHERESPRRRLSTNEEGTPRRKSVNEVESLGSTSANEEEPLRHRNAIRKEKSPSRRSPITEEFPRRHGSNKRGENTRRRSKNYDERPIRRQSKSEENNVKYAICYAAKPSKTSYACYGGIVPACLSDYVVEQYPKRTKRHEEKSAKCRSKRFDGEPVRRSSKKCVEEVPTKRRNNEEEPSKHKSRSYEIEIIEDSVRSCEAPADRRKKCREERRTKSISKNKSSCEDSSELSAEALKKSRKRSDTAKHKVEKEKTSESSKKLRTCGSGFDKVKQRLQELENELKAKGAAKDLKLREMEQLSKLRRKACKGQKRSCKMREKFDEPAESMSKVKKEKSSWKESTSPRNSRLKDGEWSVHTDRINNKEVKDIRTTKSSTRYNKDACWLDEPGVHKKNLPKESSKRPIKTEAVHVTSQNTREFKTSQTPLKSICKATRPVTARPRSPQATISTYAQATTLRSHSPCPTNPRRVSYTDDPQPTCRTCTPYSPNHRRVSYCDEPPPPTSSTSSPCSRRYQASYINEAVTPRSNISKNSCCTGNSSTASPEESKESVQKFLEEINSRIEITRDALNSPCMESVAVQPYREETTKTWHCPGRDLCPRLRERAGGDEGSELFVRRVRIDVAAKEVVGPISKFNEKSVDDSEASDCNAGAEPPYLQPSYRRCSMADFKRRQREIEELFVESFSERDC